MNVHEDLKNTENLLKVLLHLTQDTMLNGHLNTVSRHETAKWDANGMIIIQPMGGFISLDS